MDVPAHLFPSLTRGFRHCKSFNYFYTSRPRRFYRPSRIVIPVLLHTLPRNGGEKGVSIPGVWSIRQVQHGYMYLARQSGTLLKTCQLDHATARTTLGLTPLGVRWELTGERKRELWCFSNLSTGEKWQPKQTLDMVGKTKNWAWSSTGHDTKNRSRGGKGWRIKSVPPSANLVTLPWGRPATHHLGQSIEITTVPINGWVINCTKSWPPSDIEEFTLSVLECKKRTKILTMQLLLCDWPIKMSTSNNITDGSTIIFSFMILAHLARLSLPESPVGSAFLAQPWEPPS